MPHTRYSAIPSEGPVDHSDVHETPIGRDNVHSASGEISVAAHSRTKWTYFLLGCAILLPWNGVVNGMSYFLSRMTGSPLFPTFSSSLSSVYTSTKLLSQFYSTITLKQSSPSRRILVSIAAMIILVTSLCVSTYIQSTPSTFFIFTLVNAAFQGISAGYLCTAAYAGAALLGQPFLQSALSGQGAISAAASAVQVTSAVISLSGPSLNPALMKVEIKGADSKDNRVEEAAARIFFGISAVFLFITLLSYTWLASQPFYKSVIRTLGRHRGVGDTDELTGLVADDAPKAQTVANSRVYRVLRQNLIFLFSVMYVFTVTMSLFPVVTARVQSVNPDFHPLLFTAVHSLAFSGGDLIGRYSCSFPRLLVWSPKKILAMSLLRTLFIPLILLCNLHPFSTASGALPIMNSDFLFMIILLTMGFTNGYVSTVATLAVSSLAHNPRLEGREDVDVAATLGGSFSILGLASGSLCSFGVQAMI